MTTIGKFSKIGDAYEGKIITLGVQAFDVRIVPGGRRAGLDAPSHRVVVGGVEIGSAWTRRAGDGRDYLTVLLDDPSFAAPIHADLQADEDGGYSLLWQRPPADRGDG